METRSAPLDTTDLREWLNRRVRNANSLLDTFKGEGLPDALILLCCTLSALADRRWPGERFDKKRYIELLVRFTDVSPGMGLVSIPLLNRRLEKAFPEEASILSKCYFPPNAGQIVIWNEIDRAEHEIHAVIPQLPLKEIRRASYASVIYEQFRSSLVHQYSLSSEISEFPMSSRLNEPHYVNVFAGVGIVRKMLYLPYAFIRKVVESAGEKNSESWEKAITWTEPRPPKWWIDG